MVLSLLIFGVRAKAQCPDFYDTFGNPSSNPYWVSCTGNDFTLEVLSDDAYGPYTIDWGDGSTSSGAGYTPGGANPNHVYTATVDTFVVTISIPGAGCTVTGVVVMEELVSAAIQIPAGGITKACAPQIMEFLNASTNVSATTWFVWDFGDGSPNETYDASNHGATIPHIYQKGTVDCGTRVTLYAENYCSFGRPSINTYEPILIWDIDDAAIDASATLLCYPDTIVTFRNTTERNCIRPAEGNFEQRYERWRFIDYFGPGLDSIVDWRPWPPTTPITVHYPGLGTYHVELLDSNQCGIDGATIEINIVPPPTAGISLSADTVCTNEEFTVSNLSSPDANEFFWRIEGVTNWTATDRNAFTQSIATPGKYVYQMVANIAEGTVSCTDTVSDTIVVLPGPVIDFDVSPKQACDTLLTTITNNTLNGVSWSWDYGNGTTSSQRDPVNPIRYDGKGEYFISLEVSSSNNCKSTLTDTVHVYKTPTPDFDAPNACLNAPVTFLDQSVEDAGNQINSWNWNFGDGNTSMVQNPSHGYATDATYNVRLTVNTIHNCPATIIKPITLHPVPSAIMYVPDTVGCTPLQVNFQNFSTVATKYEWDLGDGSGVDTTVAPSVIYTNTSGGNLIFTPRLIAITDQGCRDTAYQQILVYPSVEAEFTHSDDNACAPMFVQFQNAVGGSVTNYEWNFGDGSPPSTDPNPAHVYNNPSAFIEVYDAVLKITSPNGCTDTVTHPITVFPEPNFDFTVDPDEGCTPLEVDFSVNTNGNYVWNFGDGSPTETVQNPTHIYSHNNLFNTTYNVKLVGTSSFGCVDSVTKTVTVKPNPVANFSMDIDASCSPLQVRFTNSSSMASSYQWQYGDGNGSTNASGSHNYTYFNSTTNDIEFVVKLTAIASNGCTDEITDTVTVYGNAEAQFDQPSASCTPYDVTFVNRSQNAATYRWDFNDGSPFENGVAPNHVFTNSTNANRDFNVQLIAYSSQMCPDTTYQTVTVYPLPNTDFDPTPTDGCHPLTVQLENQTTGASSYEWFYGNGTNSTNANQFHSVVLENNSPSTLTYEIQLVATSGFGCSRKTTKYVDVHPKVTAQAAPIASACGPLQVIFNNESVNASSFKWDFDDGNVNISDKHASHLFVNNQSTDRTFNVELIATSVHGCSDTTYVPVTVFGKPDAGFDLSDDVGCHVFTVDINNITTGASSYSWDYGNGLADNNSSLSFSHSYENTSDAPIDRTIRLVATSSQGCTDTLMRTITVLPRIVAAFEVPVPSCTPYEVKMINKSIGASQYKWYFPNQAQVNTAFEPQHTLVNSGVTNEYQTVSLVAVSNYGCEDSLAQQVLVYPRPEADFEATPPTQMYPDATVVVDNNTVDGNWGYKWEFGDGVQAFSRDPQPHLYATWGTYTITLVAEGQYCSDSTKRTIVIDPAIPVPQFDFSEEEGCVPWTVHFFNQSLYAENYTWIFGDGNNSQQENPVHTYTAPGVYTVTLIASGAGGTVQETKEQLIKVREYATAFFTLSPQYPNEVFKDREPVDFFNFSQNSDRWEWDFGDGEYSFAENPSHFYGNIGVFDVELISNNQYNCPDTFKVNTAVKVIAGGKLVMPNAFTPNPNGSNGGKIDGVILSNDVFFPFFDQVEEFHMQIFNRWGELIFETNDIDIGWDGYFNGEMCPQDVYVYKAEVVYPGGESEVLVGDVTLLR